MIRHQLMCRVVSPWPTEKDPRTWWVLPKEDKEQTE